MEERDNEKLQEVLEKKVTKALEEGCVLDQLVEDLAMMKGEERERMMQMYEAGDPRELRDRNIVAGKATIERMVEERAFEKERKKKVRLIKEGIRRKYFQQGSGPGDILNFGMYEGWRFGDVYICHPTYGEWAVDHTKPKMWKLKCYKFFLKRLADLERVLQQEERMEVKIARVSFWKNVRWRRNKEFVGQNRRKVRKGRKRKNWQEGVRNRVRGQKLRQRD